MSTPCPPHTGTTRLIRTYPSRSDFVTPFCREVNAMLQSRGLRHTAFDIELLCRESLTNAIEHGNKEQVDGSIHVEFHLGARWMLLRVRDQGAGFDHATRMNEGLPPPECENGRGLSILKSYADRVSFNTVGNQVSIWKNITGKDQPMSAYTLETSGNQVTVTPNESLTTPVTGELKNELCDAIAQGQREIVFDLSKTHVLDSSGIGLLVATHNSLQRQDGTMRITGVNEDIMRLMQTMRLDKRFHVTAHAKGDTP